MMEIRRFGMEIDDYKIADAWIAGHKALDYASEPYPEHALIAFNEGVPIAMLGIKGQQNIGIIDWLITNPQASPVLRSDAINALYEQIEHYAKNCGMNVLLAWTGKQSILKRLSQLGWDRPKMKFMVKDLRG